MAKKPKRNNARVSKTHLTKSLHTLTTVRNVAALLAFPHPLPVYSDPEALLTDVLKSIGQTRAIDLKDPTDATVAKCLEACAEVIQLSQKTAKGAA